MKSIETKHTKREWKIDQSGSMPKLRIRDINNRIICDCFSFSEAIPKDEAEANAKLIAASPLLLDALLNVRTYLLPDQYAHDDKIIELIDNAINKATQ